MYKSSLKINKDIWSNLD